MNTYIGLHKKLLANCNLSNEEIYQILEEYKKNRELSESKRISESRETKAYMGFKESKSIKKMKKGKIFIDLWMNNTSITKIIFLYENFSVR